MGGMRFATKNPAPEGLLLFHLRVHADMTQDDLQAASGVHFTTISRWETGRWRASVDHIHRVCDALKVDDETRRILLELRATAGTPRPRS